MAEEERIVIKGAKVNNLKNITVEIPRNKFIVVTGISGSGKSSLAFDTLFAEGQRRFAESLSSYARQFLGRMSKPDVEVIEGIPPAIAIEQKVNIRNPRSTVATTTEIYDYLRIIFARIGHTFSPVSGQEVKCNSINDVLASIYSGDSRTVYILADLNWSGRTDKVELMLRLKEEGFSRFYIDRSRGIDGKQDASRGQGIGQNPNIDPNPNVRDGVVRIEEIMKMAESGVYPEQLFLLIDRLKLPVFKGCLPYDEDGTSWPQTDWEDLQTRLRSSIDTAFREGDGKLVLIKEGPKGCGATRPGEPGGGDHQSTPESQGGDCPSRLEFSNRFELDGMTFRVPDEYLFSFNSPLGACPVCGGLGKIIGVSEDLVIPDKSKSIYDGAIACWKGDKMGWFRDHLIKVADRYGIRIFEPYCNLTEDEKNILWDGHSVEGDENSIVGINEFFKWVDANRYKIQYKFMLNRFSGRTTCHSCHGTRLRKEALYVQVGGKTIAQLLDMNVGQLLGFFTDLKLSEYEGTIVRKAVEEIVSRLKYIRNVGLSYLTLNRTCNTLSGGESQRVNLVTALGSSLVGSMYILDEPSIGLHPRDTDRLIGVLERLRDIGNTVVVVEHDEEMIRAADMLIDMGPEAGVNGGRVVFSGKIKDDQPKEVTDKSLTLQYLTGARARYMREKHKWTYSVTVEGAQEHNLKNVDVKFPLGVLTVVSGVSGSGKSSLVSDILYPALYRRINQTGDLPGLFKTLSGNLDRVTRVEYVDQNPIGKSSRSNAVTYLKVYDDIRKLLSDQQYARINGYTPSFFSFNQDGGRCPECQGDGFVRIPMQFMADVTMVCEACGGKRFKPDILEVRYRKKNIDDILNMSVDEAIAFFGCQPEDIARQIARRLRPLVDVGLGYIKLGQSSSTLSGGESQRIKLAYFLSLSKDGESVRKERILFLFDEPTTGLHFHDVEKLLKAFDVLIANGHTVIVVEHNLDVIRAADWVIDLGPDGGDRGGEVVFEGTPEDLAAEGKTWTAKYLKQ